MQSERIPRWLNLHIWAHSLLQVFLTIAAYWFPPDWQTIFNIPFVWFKYMMLMALGVLMIASFALYKFPGARFFKLSTQWLVKISNSPSVWLLVLFAVLSSIPLLMSPVWVGYNLLGLHFLVFCSILLNTRENFQVAPAKAGSIAIASGVMLRSIYVFTSWVWNDEGIYLSAALNWMQNHTVSAAMFYLPQNIPVRPGWGYSVAAYGIWTQIFGLGVLQIRLLSFIFGSLALVLIYFATKRLYGRQAAYLTTGFASLNHLFLLSTTGRNDAIPLFLFALVIWMHIYACQEKKRAVFFLVGLLTALSIQGHLTNLALVIGMTAYYARLYIQSAVEKRKLLLASPLWFFLPGLGAGLLLFVATNILTLPESGMYFEAIFTIVPSNTNPFQYRFTTFINRLRAYWATSAVEATLIAISAAFAIIRRRREDIHWLWLFLFVLFGYLIAAPYWGLSYSIYALPVYLTPVGSAFLQGTDQQSSRDWSRYKWLYLFVAVVLASGLFATIQTQYRGSLSANTGENQRVDYIRENIAVDSAIIGPSVWYAELPEYHNFLIGDTGDLMLGPILSNTEPEKYWAQVLVDIWPEARIIRDVGFYAPHVFSSYMKARNSQQVIEGLLVVDDKLERFISSEELDQSIPLQLAAYSDLDWDSLTIDTLWLSHISLTTDIQVEMKLLGKNEDIAGSSHEELISGWQGTLTSSWEAYVFHNSSLALPDPATAISSVREVIISYEYPDYCEPVCQFTIQVRQ